MTAMRVMALTVPPAIRHLGITHVASVRPRASGRPLRDAGGRRRPDRRTATTYRVVGPYGLATGAGWGLATARTMCWRRRQRRPPRRSSDTSNTKAKETIVEELVEIEVEAGESEEDALIYAWRVERLSELGLSYVSASLVASFVDWHEIARLVERGCSPELALEIVR